MSADEFVADPTLDELQREILLLERHIRQTTGQVPQGTSSKVKKTPRNTNRVVMNDKLTQLGGSGRRTTWG